MPSLNKVFLMGNLTRDPELRYTPNNTPVVRIGLAVNRRWRNQQGEQQEETVFVDCDAWGRTAEFINQYFHKGRPIFIEGRLRLDQWQDKEGHNRSQLRVVIENVQFVDARGPSETANHANAANRNASSPPPSAQRPAPENAVAPPVEEEDIPF